ncbi:DUF5688 family protein [Anaerostipes sp.]|uniref:DUF5688 family protein n=1 Tax=Anaerostipes sp. TaxID=1872530 RepID=UPI0025BE2AB8|nr:DUF5688 family protein [Anaerostipes sp.]MBS7007960.1 hypothetical protein [Anaerostipes sp.]
MLTRQEFFDYVEEHILEYVRDPKDKKAVMRQVTKNNNTSLNGLCIGREEETCQPIIYVDTFYTEYQSGVDLGELLCRMGALYEESRTDCPIQPELYRDYHYMKDHLFFRLVNYEKNKKQLEDCPFERVEDLAVTFRWFAHHDRDGMASALIRSQDLKLWGITEEQLGKDARENTEKVFPPLLRPMEQIFPQMRGSRGKLYVLSNREGLNGAGTVLYRGILDRFSDKVRGGFYILPSSIHEVLLVPADGESDPAALAELVREVNRTVVEGDEILSDRVYYYEKGQNLFMTKV